MIPPEITPTDMKNLITLINRTRIKGSEAELVALLKQKLLLLSSTELPIPTPIEEEVYGTTDDHNR